MWNRKKQTQKQIDSEIQYHIDALTRDNLESGMTPQEARRQAMVEFGGPTQIKEKLREVHGGAIFDGMLRNVKAALRFMRKSPSFSATVILTLGLGIGANSAVFSAIDAILLRPLPFPDSDRLVKISQFRAKSPDEVNPVAPVRLEEWNRLSFTFQDITGYYTEDITEISGALPEKISQAWVAPRFLQVWGIAPALGRDFNDDEQRFGGPAAVLLSDRLWRHKFAADPEVVGKKLRTSNGSMTIVGVMPASFLFQDKGVDLWAPVPVDAPYAQSRDSTWYHVIGRLKPEADQSKAEANLALVQRQLGGQYPKTDAQLRVRVESLKESTIGGVRHSLWLLYGSVSLLLLIACTNIVGLLLVRTRQRQHEIAVRFSLGASRGAIVAQLMSETLLLSVLGALVGLLVASGGAGVFRALARDLPRLEEIRLDGRIVLYAMASAVGSTLVCGLFPAMRGTRKGLSSTLSQAGRGQVSPQGKLPWALVGVQVALAVTLLAGAGLLLRSFQELGRVSPGFDPAHVLTLRVSGSWAETKDMKRLKERIDRTLEALRSLPGVERVATADSLPGFPDRYPMEMQIAEGRANPEDRTQAESRFVSPGYFAALKIPLLGGETCREDPGRIQVMVNRSFAKAHFPGSAGGVGRHLVPADSPQISAEIRGIVQDAREVGLDNAPVPTVYFCMSAPNPGPYYLVRTRGEPSAMAETIRKKIAEIEPGRSVFGIMPLEDRLGETFAEKRLRTILLALFALTALMLACLGIYGTLSYAVSLRRREVGLRLALGALPREVARHFLLQGVSISLLGCLAGWLVAGLLSRAIAGMLYGVSPTDAVTLVGVASLMLLVAGGASLVPALRAARLDPMRVLREE